MADDGVHDPIESRGVHRVSLVNSVLSLEGRSIITSGTEHHGKTDPVRLENLECPGSDPVRHENFEAPVPIKGFLRLLEFQKYLVEDSLPHGCDV